MKKNNIRCCCAYMLCVCAFFCLEKEIAHDSLIPPIDPPAIQPAERDARSERTRNSQQEYSQREGREKELRVPCPKVKKRPICRQAGTRAQGRMTPTQKGQDRLLPPAPSSPTFTRGLFCVASNYYDAQQLSTTHP